MKSSKLPEPERVARKKRIMRKRADMLISHANNIKAVGVYTFYAKYRGTVFAHPSLKEQRS